VLSTSGSTSGDIILYPTGASVLGTNSVLWGHQFLGQLGPLGTSVLWGTKSVSGKSVLWGSGSPVNDAASQIWGASSVGSDSADVGANAATVYDQY